MNEIHGRFDTQTIVILIVCAIIMFALGGLSLALFGFGLLT